MPHPSGWYNDRLVAKIALNNMKKPVDATLEEIKNARDRLGLSQSRFARGWISAVMTIPFRNYLLMGKSRKADDCANRSENARCGGRK